MGHFFLVSFLLALFISGGYNSLCFFSSPEPKAHR